MNNETMGNEQTRPTDVNPALEAGIGAIHVPHPNTWHLEHEEIAEPQRVIVLNCFGELKTLFLKTEAPWDFARSGCWTPQRVGGAAQ